MIIWMYLSEREWHRVLRVCPTDLNDVLKLLGFGSERVVQHLKTRQKNLMNFFSCSDVHGSGKRIIRALKQTRDTAEMKYMNQQHKYRFSC